MTIPMEYAPTADYMLDATNLTPYLVAVVLLGGALIVIVLLWMLLESRAITRADRIAEAKCRHPSGQQYTSSCPYCPWSGPVRFDPHQAIADLELHTLETIAR